MKAYELLYIIRMDLDEEAIAALIAKVNGTIESLGGKVDAVLQSDPWGRRRLAYPIGRFDEGYYVLTQFTAGSAPLGELERVLKLNEGILRYMITRRQP